MKTAHEYAWELVRELEEAQPFEDKGYRHPDEYLITQEGVGVIERCIEKVINDHKVHIQ